MIFMQLISIILFMLFMKCLRSVELFGAYILKTIKDATDKSVVFLIHYKVTHFVYVLTDFPFARER